MTCNFNRFKKVLMYDGRRTYRMFGLVMLLIVLFDLIAWGLAMTFHPFQIKDWTTSPDVRQNILTFMIILAVMLAPSIVYNNCNKRSNGIYFAMLPASRGEKFWSMVFYCYVVVPVVAAAGFMLTDMLLTLLPFGPYRDWIWEGLSSDQLLTGNMNIGNMELQNTDWMPGWFGNAVLWVLTVWFEASLFVYGNTLFKRAKFILSLISLQVLNWLLSILLVIVILIFKESIFQRIMTWESPDIFSHDMKLLIWGSTGLMALVIALCTWLSWRRLKKAQY